MSKNRNRAKLKKAECNREYSAILKNIDLYCRVCVKRAGSYSASCHPGAYNKKGSIFREFRSWKNSRTTQWKH